jgi:hypothetical protein
MELTSDIIVIGLLVILVLINLYSVLNNNKSSHYTNTPKQKQKKQSQPQPQPQQQDLVIHEDMESYIDPLE